MSTKDLAHQQVLFPHGEIPKEVESRAWQYTFNFLFFIQLVFLLVGSSVQAENEAIIKEVRVDQQALDFGNNQQVSISWYSTQRGQFTVRVMDLDGQVAATLAEGKELADGNNRLNWNGLDEKGVKCPPGVYLPIITVHTKEGQQTTYNPTSSPWGEKVHHKDLYYDLQKQAVHFRLEKAALCRIRSGEYDGGPLYRTLLDWQPREIGSHDEPWDGWDDFRVVDIARKQKHYIVMEAFSLPENAILIRDIKRFNNFDKNTERIRIYPPHDKQVNIHAHHLRNMCHEPRITAEIVDQTKNKDGLSVLHGVVEIKVFTDSPEDLARRIEKNLELYLYVDGIFNEEVIPEMPPALFRFDSTKFSNGEYTLTINIRTLDDHVGVYSMKVHIDN